MNLPNLLVKEKKTAEKRLRVVIYGAVQGVGFRPFVYRLASEMKLKGWISNHVSGVTIEAEGSEFQLKLFLNYLTGKKPPRASIQSLEPAFLDPVGYGTFEIRESLMAGEKNAFIMPDIATCDECLDEIFNPTNRRYLYPFTNCTNCGPRFSVVEALPYDRSRTSMKSFSMCEACVKEYIDPANRRFHAEPNACPKCGPQLAYWNPSGEVLSSESKAFERACQDIRRGLIVAVKGLGGFHLLADVRNEEAVKLLRIRKRRDEKPFAVMFPNLAYLKELCEISSLEERVLISPESPIVLVRKSKIASELLAETIAPNNPYLGAMLPYTPLHHMLLRELKFPIIATSGNLSEETICIDEHEAVKRLRGIADYFLVHNRPIVRHVDDSIVRIVLDRELVLRRARGFAPLPVSVSQDLPEIFAAGAHLKNTIAISRGQNIFISQYVGNLETAETRSTYRRVANDFERFYEISPEHVVCDLHPDYSSSYFAHEKTENPAKVQHHYAHILSCMAENELESPLLGVSWDGTGFGDDGTIWGGEFLHVVNGSYVRAGHFRQFRLPGGDAAIHEPRRAALGVLFEMYGNALFHFSEEPFLKPFSEREIVLLKSMLQNGIRSPRTSSAGRLFDAVSSLIGLRHIHKYEGQAAMELEFLSEYSKSNEIYPIRFENLNTTKVFDWEEMVRSILDDLKKEIPREDISAKFHNTLTEVIVQMAQHVNELKIVLSGGCFQNRYLLERSVRRLREEGFHPYWHQRIPPNDSGIALGQIMALRHLKKGKP